MSEYFNRLESEFLGLLKDVNHTHQTCHISNMAQPCGFTPDQYADAIFQKAYLLKYAYAYALDYQNLYKKLKDLSPTLKQEGVLNILSIGCGGGIDLTAAKSVFNNVNVIYAGVDAIYWNDRLDINKPDISYHNYGIDDIDDNLISSADIVIFPRSITDIPSSSLINFAKRLIELNNSFYLLFALVHSNTAANSQRDEGFNRINSMVKVIEEGRLLVEVAESSQPNVSQHISYKDYDVKVACKNNCSGKCNFIAVKHINDKGYHHIIKVMQGE